MRAPRRDLTDEELLVLNEVQAYWGAQNTPNDVFFTDEGGAGVFVRALDGSMPIYVYLTNLGRWHAEGTLTIDALRVQITGRPDQRE
jgi:hypothetical protein